MPPASPTRRRIPPGQLDENAVRLARRAVMITGAAQEDFTVDEVAKRSEIVFEDFADWRRILKGLMTEEKIHATGEIAAPPSHAPHGTPARWVFRIGSEDSGRRRHPAIEPTAPNRTKASVLTRMALLAEFESRRRPGGDFEAWYRRAMAALRRQIPQLPENL